MKRNVISINEEKCVGCGLCVNACHQGALELIDGKAKLISDSYCDGLGKCLPKCPTGALKVIEKEVEEFKGKEKKGDLNMENKLKCGCPSTNAKEIKRDETISQNVQTVSIGIKSNLRQWPCQIKLVPPNAPYFDGAKLLIAADCTAYANANVHSKFMKDKITLIGCPKLDEVDYSKKLTEIITNNDIKSVDILRMSVPCCSGLENAVKQALINSKKMIPWRIIIITPDGDIIE